MNILDNAGRLNAIKSIEGIRMSSESPVKDYLDSIKFEKHQKEILLTKLNALITKFKINIDNIDIRYNLNLCNTLDSETLRDIVRRITNLKKKETVILTIKETYL